jgi:hypothetical protein
LTEEHEDPRFLAVLELLKKTGADGFQIRYDEEQDPIVWVAVATYKTGYQCDAGFTPLSAVMRLAERLGDGGTCAHCGKPTGLSWDWDQEHPAAEHICWFIYDPETQRFRRSCEGETVGRAYGRDPRTGAIVGRNDPCPCGSGLKWKKCHGA